MSPETVASARLALLAPLEELGVINQKLNETGSWLSSGSPENAEIELLEARQCAFDAIDQLNELTEKINGMVAELRKEVTK